MKTHGGKDRACLMPACTLACILWLFAASALGGFRPALYMGNVVPILDPRGRPMAGSALPEEVAGRSRVEIRVASDGIVCPPSASGEAHPLNPLLGEDGIGGIGQNARGTNSGTFCMVFSVRPAAGTVLFARVFNAPTASQATFYADSAPVVVAKTGSSLVLEFSAAHSLDPGDDDDDGLNNSWETLLGTDDHPSADYDEDGMSDLDEMLSGTDPTDANSTLIFRFVRRESTSQELDSGVEVARPLRVKWQSVPGKKYQLEYVLKLVPDPATGGLNLFIPIGDVVTAGAGIYELEMLVNLPADALTGTFRIRLVTE